MIPTKNIDTEDLVFLLDPSSPLSFNRSKAANSIAFNGKNLFTGTKLFENSEVLGARQGTWGPNIIPQDITPKGATIVQKSLEIAPDASLGVTILQEDVGPGAKYLRYDMNVEGLIGHISPEPPEILTYSVYIKPSATTLVDRCIKIDNFNIPESGGLTVNPIDGTILYSDIHNFDEGVEDVGNGWYRIFYSIKISNLNASVQSMRTRIMLTTITGALSYTGDGTSGVYIWGAQMEDGCLSNYVETPNTDTMAAFKNRKFTSGSGNPTPYTTSLWGSNFRFDGVTGGLNSGAMIRVPFRSGGISDINDLQSHSGFVWAIVRDNANPTDNGWGYPGFENSLTFMGRIGGRQNNGCFGINKDRDTLYYKVRPLLSNGNPVTYLSTSNVFPQLQIKTWYLFSFTYDLSTKTTSFYLDGQHVGDFVNTDYPAFTFDGIQGSSGQLELGYFSVNATPIVRNQFNGIMNRVAFYEKIMDAADHLKFFENTRYRFK